MYAEFKIQDGSPFSSLQSKLDKMAGMLYITAAFCIIWGENKMDLQIEKEQLKEYSTKVKSNAAAVLWLLGTTLAAFILYAVLLVITVAFPSPEQQAL